MTSTNHTDTKAGRPNHPESLTPGRIVLHPSSFPHPHSETVSDLLYAGFLEHLGRCIYGGIVEDPADPSPQDLLEYPGGSNGKYVNGDAIGGGGGGKGEAGGNGVLGWRKDVKALLSKNGELEVPMLRWPGGEFSNFVSNYHWQDGVGPMEGRPKRLELAWLSQESNRFGTNEYIDYCRATGCEPYICLNSTLEEALAWLEYCNGTADTHWANLRRKHTGRDEPHNVKYWGLGNEMWGPWQVGNLTAKEYAAKAKMWAHALKLIDPTIHLVSCGKEGNGDWDLTVLREVAGLVDLHSIHFYSVLNQDLYPDVMAHEYENNVFGPEAAEKNIQICKSLIDFVTIERTTRVDPIGGLPLPHKEIKIAFDEWNVWDSVKAPGSNGLKQEYDYTDMLGFVAWLNLLVRNHKTVGLACLAQSVNVISPILTTSTQVLKQTTYYPLYFFSRYMKNGHLIPIDPPVDVYTGPTYPKWIKQTNQPKYIDIVGMQVSSDKPGESSIRLSILNRHPSADWEMHLKFEGFEVTSVEVHEMFSEDLNAKNTFEDPERVVPNKINMKGWKEKVKVKKHSWQFIMVNGKGL